MHEQGCDITVSDDVAARKQALLQRRQELEKSRQTDASRHRRNISDEETWFALMVRAVLATLGILKRGYQNALQPELRHLSFVFGDLPRSFHGYRILHVSDLHFSAHHRLSDQAADLLGTIEADTCVITGDFLWGKYGPYEPMRDGCAALVQRIRVREGIFAVLGNHDRYEFVEPLEQLGIQVLLNSAVPLIRGEETIWLAGVDDPSFFNTADLDVALSGVPASAFVILLAHSPDLAKTAAARGVRVYLCGHTHAGQICLPKGLAFHYNCRAPRRICRGPWRLGMMAGYTSSGLGTTELPVRYNCPPEITLIELQRI